jgi:HYR domain
MRTFAAWLLAVVTLPAIAATIDVPNSITQEATGPSGAIVTYSVSANGTGTGDDENGRPAAGTASVACSHASGSAFPVGTTTVTCNATDSAGTVSDSFTVVVTDTTGPSLNLPGGINVQATSASGANVQYGATAHDLVDGTRVVACTPASGLFAAGTHVVSCSASDSRGNQSHGSFTIEVAAMPVSEPPVLMVPDDMTVEATSPNGAAVSFSAKASGHGNGQDDENGRPTNQVNTTCSPASGSVFPLGTTTVQCTASDSGGSTSDTFAVTVADTTAPDLRLPRDFTVQASSNDGAAVSFNASALDLVDGAVSVSCSPESGSTFSIGTTSVSCTATDAYGNSAGGGFAVTVTAPDAPPPTDTLNLPDDITVEADGPSGSIVAFTVTSSGGENQGDDENGRPKGSGPAVHCAPSSGSVFALGTTTVQCTAGTASGTFLVHVVDTTAPALTLPSDITTAETTVTFDATASDLVDTDVAVTCTPPSGSTFAVGTTTVNCSAADDSGNGASGSFSVTVTDSTPSRTVTVTASPNKIWPPNKNFVGVTISVTTSDNSPFTASIISIASSENDPDDKTTPDWVITGPLTIDLRAEKSDQAQKRVYTIVVEVVDEDDVVHHKAVTVTVANDGSSSAISGGKISKSKRPPTATPAKPRRGRW